MRLKYYTLTLRQMNLKKAFVFFFLVIFSISLIIYLFNKKIEPTLDAVCSNNAKTVAFKASNEAVYEYMENVEYTDLINIEKNETGKVTSLTANVSEINKLSTEIATNIQNKLEEKRMSEITLPLSEMFGIRVIGAGGPKIKVETVIEGNIDVNFKSEFTAAGINQTKHTLYVEISTNVVTIAPFFTSEKKYVNNIMIAETVIVSDVPSSYYEVNGVDGLDEQNILDIIGD